MALPNEPSALDQVLDFDIDRYLNPWIPHNRLRYLPSPISRWFGHREKPQKEPYAVLQWPVTFLATVAGLCLVAGVNNYGAGIVALQPPVIIASLGASAVLDYNTIKSPLAQPRNAILGNTLAAICGVAAAKGFERFSNFDEIQWVSGAIGCALASWVMSLTNTVHPPGGATAVLASTEMHVLAMGWWYPLIVLLDSSLLTAVALIFNNVLRQYPIYWWTPSDVGSKLRKQRREAKEGKQEDEKMAEEGQSRTSASDNSSSRTLRREFSGPLSRVEFTDGIEDIEIKPYRIQMPHHVKLSDDEVLLLENIQERLRMHGEIDPRHTS